MRYCECLKRVAKGLSRTGKGGEGEMCFCAVKSERCVRVRFGGGEGSFR